MKKVLTMDMLWPAIPGFVVVYIGGDWNDGEYILVEDEYEYSSNFEVIGIDPCEDGIYITAKKIK